ncbi:PREDICTED: polyvinylalcohol dehydrogenase-like isoform X2 [Prunus mume]|uniref:Polyvinylalcohol dehydrogenase-like isoform X2 n=1 Tax=Prunus mume TaxID=102107 RepID=A0ABM1LJ39_PRUMU|nr:PREDICTED: polyvinylalcohol dehydrogenase-like isoform X2 [Prunus mume]XP_016647416.1 PREDICTED: polyvinylalcohol dehydrogenase-like isoform X2 [Prunus mume]
MMTSWSEGSFLNTWTNHGGDITNRRNAVGEVLINPRTVLNMRLRWSFFAGKDISATPAVADGRVYFPSWNGYLYAVDAFTGRLIWQQNLGALTGLNGTGVVVNVTVSRSTPTIAGNLLIVGIYGPALVIAVDRSNGRLVWSTQLDPRPRVLITMSGTVHLGAFYVGVSSLQEGLPAAQCCNFRGSVAKLNLRTGVILWRTYMLLDNGGRLGGYSGAAVWGSSPAIDISRRHVYVATGNLYTAPPEVTKCQERQNNQRGKPTHPDQCIGPDISTSIQFWRWIWILGGLYGPGNLADMMFSILLLWYQTTLTAHRDLIWMPTSERHPCCSPYTLTEQGVMS